MILSFTEDESQSEYFCKKWTKFGNVHLKMKVENNYEV